MFQRVTNKKLADDKSTLNKLPLNKYIFIPAVF